jgi:hypothetical protein
MRTCELYLKLFMSYAKQRNLSVFVESFVDCLFCRDVGYVTWIVIITPSFGKNYFSSAAVDQP